LSNKKPDPIAKSLASLPKVKSFSAQLFLLALSNVFDNFAFDSMMWLLSGSEEFGISKLRAIAVGFWSAVEKFECHRYREISSDERFCLLISIDSYLST
jgi:hypothetical protein